MDLYSETGKPVRNLKTQLGYISSVALSPDGTRLLYSAYNSYGAKAMPSSIGLMDVATGNQMALITASTGPPANPFVNNGSAFVGAAFTHDGTQMVTINAERTLQIWDAGGKLVRTLPIRALGTIFAIAPDGRAITGIAGNELVFQDLLVGGLTRPVAPIATSNGTQAGLQSALFSIALSRDRTTVLTTSSSGVDTWSASTGAHMRNFPLRNANGAVFTADGGIVALTRDGVIHVVPQTTEQLIRAGLSRVDREWQDVECQAIPLPAENCTVLVAGLNDIAKANKLALAGGDRAQIVRFLALATEADHRWSEFLDPAIDADRLIAGIATMTSRYKAEGLAARGEAAAARGDTDGAAKWFQLSSEAGDRSIQFPAVRASGARSAAIAALSGVLTGMATRIAITNETLRPIAAEYLTAANALNPKTGFDAPKEVERIVARDQAAKASGLDPVTANSIYRDIEDSTPGVVTSSQWNTVCWRGSLAAAKARNRAEAAKVFAYACERAVSLSNGTNTNALYRDSRGLNLALQGDNPAAIADFQEYVKANGTSSTAKQRQRWIDALAVNKDPFTPEEIATLF